MSLWPNEPLVDLVDVGGVVREVPIVGSGLRYLGMENVESQSGRVLGLIDAAEIRSASPRVQAGTLLYGRLRPYLNKVAIAPHELYASGEFIPMVPRPTVDSRYLRHRLSAQDFVAFATALNAGDRPRVKWGQIAQFRIGIPDVYEQRRIVDILEDHLSRLDSAEASLRQTSARTQMLRKATIHNEMNRLSRRAPTVRLDSLVSEGRRIAYGVLQPGPDVAGGVPLVRVGDLLSDLNDSRSLKHVAPSISSRFPRTILRGGEVLVSVVGTIGRTAVAPPSLVGANTARAVAVIPVDERASSAFVSLAIQDPAAQEFLSQSAHEVARKTLNLEDVRRLEIALPPRADQERVVQEIEVGLDGAKRLGIAGERAELRSASLRRAVLDAAFSGRLSGRESDADRIEELAASR